MEESIAPQSTATILIVDDDPDVRNVLGLVLEGEHYLIRAAENGSAALAVCARQLPDLILLDIKMPGLDGVAVCAQVKQMAGGEHVPILMITALDSKAMIEQAFEAGATDYITKPINTTVLRRRVHRLLRTVRAEAKLRASEAWLNSIITAVAEAVIVVDAQQQIRLFNAGAEQIFGYRESEIIGQPIQWLLPEAWAPHPAANLSAFLASPDAVFQLGLQQRFYGRRKDGHEFPMEASVSKVGPLRPEAVVIIVRDVTERVKAEEALRTSEEKFRGLFETSRDFLYITKVDGEIIEVNNAASTLSGYSVDELKTMKLQDLYFDPNEIDLAINEISEWGFVENLEVKGKRKDGTVIAALMNSTVIKDAAGNTVGFQGSIKDITERKQAGEVLQERASFPALNLNPGPILRVDASGFVQLANPAAVSLGLDANVSLRSIIPSLLSLDLSDCIRAGTARVYEARIHDRVFQLMVRGVPAMNQAFVFGNDITERKQIEETLRRSEASLAEAQRIAHFGSWTWDLARGELQCSDEMFRMVGLLPQEAEITQEVFLRFLHPDGVEWMLQEIQRSSASEPLAGIEHRITRSNGEIRNAYSRVKVYRDANGNPLRLLGSTQDITDRKQVEEALRAKVAALQMLSDISQAIVSSLDLDQMLLALLKKVQEAAEAEACSVALIEQGSGDLVFRQAVGGGAQEVLGLRLQPGEGLAGWVAQHRQSVLVPDASVDARVHSWASTSGFVTRSLIGIPLIARNRVTGVIEIINKRSGIFDEDDRRLLESAAAQAAIVIENAHLLENTQQALKEVNALYRINQGLVASLDPQELLRDVVDLLQINFGYSHAQIYVVESDTGDFIVRAGSGEIGRQLMEQGYRLRAGEGIVGYTAETDAPFFTNDVEKLFSFVRNPLLPNTKSELAVPVKIEGHIVGLLDIQQVPPGYLTQRDISLVSAVADQLAIALQKANLYSELQASLKMEQAIRLQMVQSERLAVMGRLLASVSHELNNPLQAIQNALFLLRQETGISAQGRQDLDIVLSETERLSALINRLRASYRSTQVEDFQPVQINHIIEDVYALVATHLRHNEITFEFQPDLELPEIPGLADQIRQVLLNLFMNAVEAMTTGGRLTVSTQCLAESHEVLIQVSDTGPGINPAILPNLFDAFVTDKEHGTGLGLNITYDIITKHHGRIRAENKPSGGAIFSAWLPCGDEVSA